jgi:hypothetical protein
VSTLINATGGQITISMTGIAGDPQVNGIEIVAASPDFTIAISPSYQVVAPGSSTTYTVTTTAFGGFNDAIGFDAPNLPAGVSVNFNPAAITGSGTTTVTVTTTAGTTPLGSMPFRVVGTSGALSHGTLPVSLDIATGTPIRINAGGGAYTDSGGHQWTADSGFQQGSTFTTGAAIEGTADSTLYNSLRYSTAGALVYQFNVPNGIYYYDLKFAELFYTTPGHRVFNVAVNGFGIASNLDIVTAAGGANSAYDLTGVINVVGGQITFTFTGVTGDPQVNAIDIHQ